MTEGIGSPLVGGDDRGDMDPRSWAGMTEKELGDDRGDWIPARWRG